MKESEKSDGSVRRPIFPTSLHEDTANVVYEYFSKEAAVDTVLVVNSCARGQAVAESDLDFAILAEPGTATGKLTSIQAKWDKFASEDGKTEKYKASSKFAHLHLEVISGKFTPAILEAGGRARLFRS